MEGVGAAKGGQTAVPSLPVTAPCWRQCVLPSGKSPSLPNQVFYRLLRLSAKLCKTRVGLESWGCSPEGRKWSRLEPKDHRGGSCWCSPWARKWAVGRKFTLSGGTSRAIVPFYLAVSRTPLNSVIFMAGQIFKKKKRWGEGRRFSGFSAAPDMKSPLHVLSFPSMAGTCWHGKKGSLCGHCAVVIPPKYKWQQSIPLEPWKM